ncbi:MAG: DUF411 domain-containing protein [Thalassobaculum sp.]|uniref:DUF411 domain-containing protein n=1 Tax=Thalassobaculum sp. TaxID=2022740 RepID=UPI0032EE6988
MRIRKALFPAAAGIIALAAVAFAAPVLTARPAEAEQEVEVWKSPTCGCCKGWVEHLRAAGFAVTVHDVDDVQPMKTMAGVPDRLASCHTAKVGGYVVEGHVPAADIRRLLGEKPRALGLSVPGMPADAPGMDMRTGEPYSVVLFGSPDGDKVYARH